MYKKALCSACKVVAKVVEERQDAIQTRRDASSGSGTLRRSLKAEQEHGIQSHAVSATPHSRILRVGS